MARKLITNAQIDAYIQAIIPYAQHHATGVTNVIMPLSQAVRTRINLGIDQIEVFERSGIIARTCWVTFKGPPWRKYCFSYNHSTGMIDLKQRSTQGRLIFQFNDQTPHAVILQQAALL